MRGGVEFFGGGNGSLVGVERDAGNSVDGRMFRTGGVAGLYGAVEVRAITVHFRLYLCEGRGSQVLTEQIHDLLVVFYQVVYCVGPTAVEHYGALFFSSGRHWPCMVIRWWRQ